MKKVVGVIGSDGPISSEIAGMAEKIGSEIARKGFVLLCGGRGGVMEAACRGCKNNGGLTVGILPSLDKMQANKHVDIAIPTSLGYARNAIVASAPDILISIYGSAGTLAEIAMALNYKKPVVIVESSGGISEEIKKLKLNGEYTQLIHYSTPEKAVETAAKLI
ncbi:MAG: TIGR00725 family protein [Candidatus Altiarchaeales archaeon]|nr:TIGR00725 family protein [Candidatus Altiarchaeales archaeon]